MTLTHIGVIKCMYVALLHFSGLIRVSSILNCCISSIFASIRHLVICKKITCATFNGDSLMITSYYQILRKFFFEHSLLAKSIMNRE